MFLGMSELGSEAERDPIGNLFADPSANFNGVPKVHAAVHARVDDLARRSSVVSNTCIVPVTMLSSAK